jgi:ABC-2 type transport system ATP-binding protein
MGQPMIRAAAIDKSFGSRRVLSKIDLRVEAGERIGMLGPNGAGKTTLLRLLCGYLAPDGGELEIAGVDARRQPERVGRHVGYLPEGAPAYSEMRARSYLMMRARLKGLPRGEAAAAADAALDRVDLADRAASPIGTLSRGMRQRLGLAEATVTDPPLLLLDEPTSGLDPAQLRHLVELVAALAPGRALIFSSHRLEAIGNLCDRAVALAGGRVVYDGPLADMASSHDGDLEAAYLELTATSADARAASG